MLVRIIELNAQVVPKETRIVNTPVNCFFPQDPIHTVIDSTLDN